MNASIYQLVPIWVKSLLKFIWPDRRRLGLLASLFSFSFVPTQGGSPVALPSLQPTLPVRVASLRQGATTLGSPAVAEVLLAIRINEQDVKETARLLRLQDGQILAREADIRRWRLRLPSLQSLRYEGEDYYSLSGLKGLSYRIDESKQELLIQARPEMFLPTVIGGRPAGLVSPPSPPWGGVVNYDLFVQRTGRQNQLSGLLEPELFNRWGVGVSNFLGRDLSDSPRLTRLETTWTWDQPDKLTSLRLGDTIGQTGLWSRSVLFGGLQWGTNFATQPGFVPFPLPRIAGEAALPSTFDLYVNNILRTRQDVPPGPFEINSLPIITGQGEVRLVLRDLFGREQIVTQPYYASNRLLSQGLQDYAYEIGFVRKNFGLQSNDYGRFLVTGTHRWGLTDWFTDELRAELLQDQQTVGFGGSYIWSSLGVLSAAAAGSRSSWGEGGLLSFDFERQAVRGFSMGLHTQTTTPKFTQVGLQPEQAAPRLLVDGRVSFSAGAYGSFAFGYMNLNFRDQPNLQIVSGTYNVNLGKGFFFTFSAFSTVDREPSRALGVTLTRALGERTAVTTSATAQRAADQATLEIQRNLPVGSGIGYHVLVGRGDVNRTEAGVSLQNDVGTYAFEFARLQEQNSYRLSVSGGLGILDGYPFLSRQVESSFALVQVPDYPNVRVYADNQLVARTDTKGYALLPRLRPYQSNPVRIEAEDLPLDAQIDTLQLEAIPYFRSGVLLKFPIRPSRGALLSIVLDDGTPLPAGAVVRIVGQAQEFPVALRGEAYVTGLAVSNQLEATWRTQTCTFTVNVPATSEPLPHLGTFLCQGVRP